MSIRDIARTTNEPLKLMGAEYTVEDTGSVRDEPVIHLLCRRPDGDYRHLEVTDFHPYFYVSTKAFRDNKQELLTEGRIRHLEVPQHVYDADDDLQYTDAVVPADEGVNTLRGNDLVKVTVGIPKHVSSKDDTGLADWFHDNDYETWEADVFFSHRFLISTGIKTGFTAPATKDRVSVDELEPLDTDNTPDALPRTIYLDIEVYADGEFPEPTEATQPVTAISAYDNYDEEYKGWLLYNEDWDGDIPGAGDRLDPDEMAAYFEGELADRWPAAEVRVFTDEAHLLDDFHDYVADRRPDIMTGWNAASNDIGNGFDFPYLVNRSKKTNAWNIEEWSPLTSGDVFTTRAGTAVVEGVELFDMLEAYEKTQIHELKQKTLDYVAQKELGVGKAEMPDLDGAWQDDPVQFMHYNLRDTEAVVEIDHAQDSVDDDVDREPYHGVLKMYDHLRDVTGQFYTECHHNISMIDMLFLRDAYGKNLALPTSTKPDVDHYHGAKVFTPSPGKSENVFYPDLASLYPNLFWATNMSPETIIGNREALEDSEWTEDDCFVVYWDPRDWEVKKDDDHEDYDPEKHEEGLYVLKPDIREGFVRDAIGDLIDMKYEYKGTDKYSAIKRVTNSVYGYMGDKDTYGVGSRLFNVKIAEAITLAGRKVLEFTAHQIRDWLQRNGYPNAEIVGGDTDSAMAKVPGYDLDPDELERDHERLKNGEEPQTPIFKAAEYANDAYDEFMAETFNIDVDEGFAHKMEVEVESASDALFFKYDDEDVSYTTNDEGMLVRDERDGKKKRYSQSEVWDEDDGVIDPPEVSHTGWDLLRSDTSEVTAWAQAEVLKLILLQDDPKDAVFDFLEDAIDHLKRGDLDGLSEMAGREFTLESVGIPKSISSAPPEEYGVDDETGENTRTPHPHIRGAKWTTQNIEGEQIEQGAKPYLYHIQPGKVGSYPEVYSADTLEDGDLVDAVSVEDPDNLPSEVRVGWMTMTDKLLKRPLVGIIQTMGWRWNDITSQGRQTGLDAWAT